MARKARQRISYVLPLANSPGGHRLGVNGLAVDRDRSILYTGGRDGVICAWDLNLDLNQPLKTPTSSPKPTKSSFHSQVQAHTHWVNDIILTQSSSALVSASSDVTVKVWRPHSEESQSPTTIGLHSDYVKCLASPSSHCDWVASGGLDRKIRLWDLGGKGEKLQIDVGEDENTAKGSVYALSVRDSVMASGGPENTVRLWDPRTGKRITKLVGHTDNVRSILITEQGDTVMTASSDQTVKVWSVTGGRCLYTLTMHNHSVWSLYSDHPQLSVFYSSDRSGMVAKTDTRGTPELDQGLSIAVAQEHEGVGKIVVGGNYIWTATSSSSVNRWKDVETEDVEFSIPESIQKHRNSSVAPDFKLQRTTSQENAPTKKTGEREPLPVNSVLRMSNASVLPFSWVRNEDLAPLSSGESLRKQSEDLLDSELGSLVAIKHTPEETIEGQNGLIKHIMLNDRKRVLTVDTAGEVVLWDLIKCAPVQSFGKRHMEDILPEVNTLESVTNWCTVDTRTGTLAVSLEENYCFDAEMYADEIQEKNDYDFREDQRINFGRWILRYLFAGLIDEEIARDEIFRKSLKPPSDQQSGLQRVNRPTSIPMPVTSPTFHRNQDDEDSVITPKGYPATTPGLAIGVATPGATAAPSQTDTTQNPLPANADEHATLEKQKTRNSQGRNSGDYFSAAPPLPSTANAQTNGTHPTAQPEASASSPVDAEKTEKGKEGGSLFGKKFRMNFPKKLGRSSVEAKPIVVDEKSEDSDDKSSEVESKVVEDNFLGSIQKIRYEYEERLQNEPPESIDSAITPSGPTETPVLKLPSMTPLIISEDRPDAGGVADLYRGTIGSVGKDANVIEKCAPMWLGDLLLRNQTPHKEVVKVSFVLTPFEDLLPSVASDDGNSRLNANRMLRARKILSYVADRIEPAGEIPDPNVMKPEDYLELYCQGQLVPNTMTLATLRAHIWKTGGDVMLYYKSNGRRPELEKRMKRKPGMTNGEADAN
ncbi:hypothetical protein MMC25_005497 [Agyrium rufum]|nr:hypothetical protein [Agyrium rufum]